jgi:hypothetical protein
MPQRRPPTDRERERRRENQRRYRQRQHDGETVYPVVGNAKILNLLARNHHITERDMHDRNKVGAAIRRLLLEAEDAKNP